MNNSRTDVFVRRYECGKVWQNENNLLLRRHCWVPWWKKKDFKWGILRYKHEQNVDANECKKLWRTTSEGDKNWYCPLWIRGALWCNHMKYIYVIVSKKIIWWSTKKVDNYKKRIEQKTSEKVDMKTISKLIIW